MKKRKLKGFVLPTLYLLISITIFTGVILLGSDYNLAMKDYNYTTEILKKDEIPVLNEDDTSSIIISPVEEGKADISIHYYKIGDNEENQRNSLIYYENTYMPNTGLLYTSDDVFNVINIFDGKVSEIINDDFFTKCLVIEHDNNIKSYYYGLDEITVQVGDFVNTGDMLGISRNNNIFLFQNL